MRHSANGVISVKASRHALVRTTIGVHLMVATALAPTAVGQAREPDPRAPTAIELALAEYSCRLQPSVKTDAEHFDCVSAGVASLRSDFGYDLSRLTSAQRNSIDKSCGPRRTAVGHDAYIACVTDELTLLWTRKSSAVPLTTPDPVSAGAPATTPSLESTPRLSWSTVAFWVVGLVGLGAAVGGGFQVAMKVKAARHRCRSCGTAVPPTADLCPDCRKQAAEAVRHAAAERAEREREQEESERRLEQQKLEQLKEEQRARDEAVARMLREQEEQRERAAEADEARLREQATLPSEPEPEPADDSTQVRDESVFDPHAVLGISPDAGADAVLSAYHEARSKYDPSLVEFLGDEVRTYYQAKAADVERAYQMLTVVDEPPSPSAP